MRFSFVLCALAFCACELFSQPEEPSITLEVVSPKAGTVGAFIDYRMKRTGSFRVSRVYAAESGSSTVLRQAECDLNFGPTCEGRFEFPSRAELTYDVWADLVLNDENDTTLVTEKQPVRIDARLVTVAPLTLNDPTKVRVLVTGANDLDPATLENIRVEREFARLPYIDLPTFRGFGLGKVDVPVTATYSGNFLELRGDFRGPATYTLHLETVANTAGMTVKNPVTIEQSYFVGAESLGEVFVSGVGISPHFEKAADGRLFLVHNRRIRALQNGAWVDLVTWTGDADALVAPDGTPHLLTVDQTGALVRRWDGVSWVNLALAPVPPSRSGENNDFLASFVITTSGELYVATMRSPAVPIVTDLLLQKWTGTQWQTVLTRTYPQNSGFVTLLRFGDTVALGRGEEIETVSGLIVPNPKTTLDTLGPYGQFSWRHVRHDAAGTPWLLGSYTDASLPGNEPAIGASGVAMLKFEGGGWTVVTKGALLEQGWTPLSEGSALFIEEVTVSSWGFDASGVPMVFTREKVNPSRIPVNARLLISGYGAVEGRWAPRPDAPSPMLADELHRVPSPFGVMDPTVLYDAMPDGSGRLWTVSQWYRRATGVSDFVVSSHR